MDFERANLVRRKIKKEGESGQETIPTSGEETTASNADLKLNRRRFLQAAGATAGLVVAGDVGFRIYKKCEESSSEIKKPNDILPNGDFTEEGRKERTETLAEGVKVFRDENGLTFYIVEKDDSISKIRRKLSAIPEFAYLNDDSKMKIKSFNIPIRSLKPGMFIPIPLEAEKRVISDQEMRDASNQAIELVLTNEVYGSAIKELLNHIDRGDLLSAMLAAAKQESGNPPGTMALHRWEPGKKSFSFSYYHILMSGPGFRGRKNLGLTEGMTYDPNHASQLFLAFLIEKFGKNKMKYLGQILHFNKLSNCHRFAYRYNGAYYKRTNPHYVPNIHKYYKEAQKKF